MAFSPLLKHGSSHFCIQITKYITRPHPTCSESARKVLKSAMSKLSAVSKSGGLMPNLVSQSTKGSDVAETKKAKGIDTEHNSSDGRQESPSLQDAAADSAEGQGGGASKQA